MKVIQYLSCSSMCTFEMSPEKFASKYLYGEKERITRNIHYGKLLADGMENDEATGDPLLDLMASRLPKYDLADKVIESDGGVEIINPHDGKKYKVPFLQDGKEKIPLVAKPDSAKSDYTAFLEYKTSTRKWSQRMADDSGQITFYATAMWLATVKIPQDIELVNVPVAYQEDGRLAPTGEMYRFPTRRSISDVIKMTGRMRKAWSGIHELCEKELI